VKRVLVSILLLPAMIVAYGLAVRSDQVLNFILGPDDDPLYFCSAPDPSPIADMGSSTVLQECSAGKTVTIGLGETVAVDLLNCYRAVAQSDWHDFNVSDESVLRTVVSPTTRGIAPRTDEIAVYRSLKAGQSTISVIPVNCGANGHPSRDHRWKVTVEVS
jgi:hypothetical protein